MKSPRDRFLDRLLVLAKICKEESVADVAELYDRVFSKIGYDAGTKAVEKVILERGSRDPFPSIAELRKAAVGGPEDIDLAVEAAGKIFEAITKCGWNAPGKAQEYMGDIAWRVVGQFGGWVTLCESITTRNSGTFRAQFRDAALASIRLAKQGRLDAAPTFASLGKSTTDLQKLVSGVAGQLEPKDNARYGGTDERTKMLQVPGDDPANDGN